MIPLQLKLKNFLSYRQAALDFRGLHVACVCGQNGAGKSSLLEAIAWAIWGESRATHEDDVIHQGETEAQVEFTFSCRQQTYRVLRTRVRGQTSSLELQIETPTGFRPLTERGMRATQQLILQHLRLDYETFVNSAYLRQGRADEFMLKRPGERKQILADLLKLDQYDEAAETARERSRLAKAELDVLERSLETLAQQLEAGASLSAECKALRATIDTWQQDQTSDTDALHQLQAVQQQRRTWTQQLHLHQQQEQRLRQDGQRLQQDLAAAQQQLRSLEATLSKADEITAGYTEFHSLQTEEEIQSAKFHAHQAAIAQRDQLQQQLNTQLAALQDQHLRLQAQRDTLQQQIQELQHTLAKAPDLDTALENLRMARERLVQLDQLQSQAAPLMQRQQQIRATLDRAQARLQARLEEYQTTRQQLLQQQGQQAQACQALTAIMERSAYLENRRRYQQELREKGMERRTFMERLQERQRELEAQVAGLDNKMALLQQQMPGAIAQPASSLEPQRTSSERASERASERSSELSSVPLEAERSDSAGIRKRRGKPKRTTLKVLPDAALMVHGQEQPGSQGSFPPCPLCDRPLDEHHWAVVMERHHAEKQELYDQLWVIREQLAVSEREIQVLRQEYRDLEKELADYSDVLQLQGQLQQQVQDRATVEARLQQLAQEEADLGRSLQTGDYAPDLHEELRLLDETLAQLQYDDRDHALARGEVDRWRWAEIKHAELKQAQKRLQQLLAQQPELEAQLATVEQQRAELLNQSVLQRQIRDLEQQIEAIAYNLKRHTTLRNALRLAQVWQLRHQELQQAQQQYPQVQQQVKDLAARLTERSHLLDTLSADIRALVQQIEATPDPARAIATLEQQIQQRRTQLDAGLANLGRLEQQIQQLAALEQQQADLLIQQRNLQRQRQVYHELAQAFGKNGIQALMIENVLPQLEAEANQILGRLSNHQLHIRFVTQRARRKGKSTSPQGLIDTLDILIADANGTRPYETYSGGEAFRVNFSIRLALARLLSQRSGTAMQMLIVDEGFGTQDDAGCDRLIAAIQAIAPDFACILTVTHMPRFKEAFQTHIEVTKTDQGSALSLAF
ncbi:AAA family ATPase [Thermoleptolyngbya sp. M55_K2018_002]|uniref:AAA family ATPase n=1 Tax=Thermoleptolyngbya sp. M55_K2018_002 TaxID=2747808 RepID=UPI0019E2C9A5|nr:AAA family ATPase [Thermoleptolyngbya sp. M55_K2018_002]HIK40542.1 AAA family ATPase [Thermoleptolyngbya sp. M55_K2018_002]